METHPELQTVISGYLPLANGLGVGMVTRNKEKSWRRPWKRSGGLNGRKPPTCQDPVGRTQGE